MPNVLGELEVVLFDVASEFEFDSVILKSQGVTISLVNNDDSLPWHVACVVVLCWLGC